MKIVSYAQNLEDVMLWRALKNVKNGFYIDIGANHPGVDSVTKLFYENGWSGINVEPEIELYQLLNEDRHRDLNLNIAISSKVESIEFYVSQIRGWSSTDKNTLENLKDKNSFLETRTVQAFSLDKVCEDYKVDVVHFLKIDVEGAEKDVLESFTFDKIRPWICVVEATKPTTNIDTSHEWEDILIKNKYIFAYFDGLNKYYVAKEESHLVDIIKTPPNVFDEYILKSHQDAILVSSQAEAKASQAEAKASQAEAKASQAEAKASQAEAKASQAEAKASQAINNYTMVINSKSYKITKPLRNAKKAIKWFVVGSKSWLTFVPNSRPERILKFIIKKLANYVKRKPYLKSKLLRILNYFPTIKNRLKNISIKDKNELYILNDNKCRKLELTTKLIIYYYVDHTCTFEYNTGLQRVTRLLAKSIISHEIEIRLVKWSVENNNFNYLNNSELLNISSFGGPKLKDINYFNNENNCIFVEQTHINSTNSWLLVPEVTYINNYSLDLTKQVISKAKEFQLKTAFIYYDSIPLRREELKFNAPIHQQYMNALRNVDLIIAISQYSGNDFLDISEKVKVLHLPAESSLSPRIAQISAKNKNIILSVGSITIHKNQMTLVKAFNDICLELPNLDWELVFIGNIAVDIQDEFNKMIKRNKKVKFLQNASEEILIKSYKECSFTVFPSLEEGYGLPIVESLWFAKPCICANFGAMNEVSNVGGTINIDTTQAESIKEAILALINDKKKLKTLEEEAINADLKNWVDYGEEIIDILNKENLIKEDGNKTNRIFWLGMHKVLVKTELIRLRELGYEVYNPPYLSNIQDQSANLDWDSTQKTTLPKEVFDKLSKTNFFYNSIDREIYNILNKYFDTVIVTITPYWLETILNGFEGRIIYRVYGQSDRLSDKIETMKLKKKIKDSDKFYFMPFAEESINDEEPWLRKNETIVPYCLTDDIFGYVDAWNYLGAKTKEVAISCPNISNAYYLEHYNYINEHYKGDYFKLYGTQLTEVTDERIVGSIPRHQLINQWLNSVAYIYTYSDPKVCYLPPIEMMVLGVPVLFPQGCLLDKYFDGIDTPARFSTPAEAMGIIEKIRSGDENLVYEIVKHQKNIWNRYSPKHVWPIFDDAINEIIKKGK